MLFDFRMQKSGQNDHPNFWVYYSKLTYEEQQPMSAIWTFFSWSWSNQVLSISRLREHLPWRVDSVNSPCRSKVVSFLKVAIAATFLSEKKLLEATGEVPVLV